MPYASASFHNIRTIRASSTRTGGAPLTLTLFADDGIDNGHVTVFTGDQALTDRLIQAINHVTGFAGEEPATSQRLPHPDDYRD
jgi:hypothetical protein